jgi:hypothetical protein
MTDTSKAQKSPETPPKKRQRRSLAKIRKDNSEQILLVAERVFGEKGYSGATISLPHLRGFWVLASLTSCSITL